MSRLLAIDPSSTRTGVAVFDDGQLIDAMVLVPKDTDDADIRIDAMVEDLGRILAKLTPELIVIEVPSGRPGAGIKAGAKAQLAIYGLAVGELRRVVKAWAAGRTPCQVLSVTERDWTLGRSKKRRAQRMLMLHPGMRELLTEHDRGHDAADAIGIGEWYLGSEIALIRKLEAMR